MLVLVAGCVPDGAEPPSPVDWSLEAGDADGNSR